MSDSHNAPPLDWVPRPVPPLGFTSFRQPQFDLTPSLPNGTPPPAPQWGVGQTVPIGSYGPTAAQMDEVIKALNRIADILVRTV